MQGHTRRDFLQLTAALAVSTPAAAIAELQEKIATRTIPGSNDELPVIGLGNSQSFRDGDKEGSKVLLERLNRFGGSYVDCSGGSRFVVAEVGSELGISKDLFMGTYFDPRDPAASHDQARQLLQITGKEKLDLMTTFTEIAAEHWDAMQGFRKDGLTHRIGTARHNERFYDDMARLMETGTVDVLQVNYSILEPGAADRILPMAMDKGVAVTVNRPFINGQYFGVVKGHELPEWTSEFDCESWAQYSLKYIISHPAVSCVLTETANPKHAVDNLRAGFGRLPDAAMRKRMHQHLMSLV